MPESLTPETDSPALTSLAGSTMLLAYLHQATGDVLQRVVRLQAYGLLLVAGCAVLLLLGLGLGLLAGPGPASPGRPLPLARIHLKTPSHLASYAPQPRPMRQEAADVLQE